MVVAWVLPAAFKTYPLTTTFLSWSGFCVWMHCRAEDAMTKTRWTTLIKVGGVFWLVGCVLSFVASNPIKTLVLVIGGFFLFDKFRKHDGQDKKGT